MICIKNVAVHNIARAVYSARNAMNSWDRSDSDIEHDILGENDLDLAKRLAKAGTEHRKYLRMITVYMDVTAPMYWWSEYDTYKVGTVANSCSKMHTLMRSELTEKDFSTDHMLPEALSLLRLELNTINAYRRRFLQTADKEMWYSVIQLLPTSFNQTRTVMLNYEVAMTIIRQRTGHKLDEWKEFVEELKGLPYMKEICGTDGSKQPH